MLRPLLGAVPLEHETRSQGGNVKHGDRLDIKKCLPLGFWEAWALLCKALKQHPLTGGPGVALNLA